jgi:hypothetical protein
VLKRRILRTTSPVSNCRRFILTVLLRLIANTRRAV